MERMRGSEGSGEGAISVVGVVCVRGQGDGVGRGDGFVIVEGRAVI